MSGFEGDNPDATIALAYALPNLRDDFSALIALDAQLGRIYYRTKEPMLAQIRFAWWREALAGLTADSAPSDPVLAAAGALTGRHDVKGHGLAELVNGWETLLDEVGPIEDRLRGFALQRGGALFALAAAVAKISSDEAIEGCGEAWALADLGMRSAEAEIAVKAFALARDLQRTARASALPKRLRAFAILARFGELDAAAEPARRARPGSPRRMFQALCFVISSGRL